jgi:hypothetical protein
MSQNYESDREMPAAEFAPGKAYWSQRLALSRSRERILALSRAVNRPSDLSIYQFAQLLASALEFGPDLIVELGRGSGNSTCLFTEAANQLAASSQPCRVMSLCNSASWNDETVPRLRQAVPRGWFEPLNAIRCDILTFDFAQALSGASRVLLFWDAHGFEIAECVLGAILPELASRKHLVIMHDLSDTRYAARGLSDYAGHRLWKGVSAGEERLRLGTIDSAVAQAISIQDFTSRNQITLDSADHSIDVEIAQTPDRVGEMRRLLGEELFGLQAHWFWFTLNERPGPYTFPRFVAPAPHAKGFWASCRALLRH